MTEFENTINERQTHDHEGERIRPDGAMKAEAIVVYDYGRWHWWAMGAIGHANTYSEACAAVEQEICKQDDEWIWRQQEVSCETEKT